MFLQFLSIPKSYKLIDIDVEGQELLNRSLAKGKGIILATGHFGKWEIMSAWLGYSGYPCVAVALRQKTGVLIFFQGIPGKYRYEDDFSQIVIKTYASRFKRK